MSAITKTYSVLPPEGSTTTQVEVYKTKKHCSNIVNVGVFVLLDFYCLDHENVRKMLLTRTFRLNHITVHVKLCSKDVNMQL